jgi:dipeptide/tripeptide permease
MAADLGAVIGPLVAGLIADEYSYSVAFLSTAAVVAAGLVASVFSAETRHRRPVAAPADPTGAA